MRCRLAFRAAARLCFRGVIRLQFIANSSEYCRLGDDS